MFVVDRTQNAPGPFLPFDSAMVLLDSSNSSLPQRDWQYSVGYADQAVTGDAK
jgi:hypothetical protein